MRLIFAILVLFTFNSHARDTIAEHASGLPAQVGTKLVIENFVPVQARRIRSTPVLWIHFDFLRSRGVEIPPEGYTPAFTEEFSRNFGWGIPVHGEDISTFTNEI